ncbi:LLM class flavin-dependent oxidoreductase [Pseudonocardia bannensis]|uniref:LLM class flavin-dependent oxidoreductase n=1 Tax=Pseudonocardia bannensis TaxID=630973 RepID=A0A848DCW8_9PSEU|nr:LLM class flavin-dependent oxidoreductase [Pseudonocardia bannensis]
MTERGARLDESPEIVAALLRGEAVDHPGSLLPTRSPALEPAPDPVPPLVVGGRSDAGLRRAARTAEGWLGVCTSPRRLRRARERLQEHAAEYGRPPCTSLMMVFTHVIAGAQSREAAREERARFVAGQYGLALEAVERWSLIGDGREVAEGLAALRAAGAAGFVLFPAAADPLVQYERLARMRQHPRRVTRPADLREIGARAAGRFRRPATRAAVSSGRRRSGVGAVRPASCTDHRRVAGGSPDDGDERHPISFSLRRVRTRRPGAPRRAPRAPGSARAGRPRTW